MKPFIILPLGITNTYLIKGKSDLLIDAGPKNKLKSLEKQLKQHDLRIQDIDYILIAHSHWDHIGSLAAIKKASGAKVLAHISEKDAIQNSNLLKPKGHGFYPKMLQVMMSTLAPFYKIEPTSVDIEINEESFSLQEYGIEATIIHTPGHSPGSLSLVLNSGEAFVSDLLMGGFPKLNGPGKTIFYDDESALIKSWKKLLEMNVKTIYPAHGKPFSVDVVENEIEKSN
jgi:hydroxyacylglutathione hydrolase